MKINKYLYVSKSGSGVNSTDEMVFFPVNRIMGFDGTDTSGEVGKMFMLKVAEVGQDHATKTTTIEVEFESGYLFEAVSELCEALCSNPKDGFIPLDGDGGELLPGNNAKYITAIHDIDVEE